MVDIHHLGGALSSFREILSSNSPPRRTFCIGGAISIEQIPRTISHGGPNLPYQLSHLIGGYLSLFDVRAYLARPTLSFFHSRVSKNGGTHLAYRRNPIRPERGRLLAEFRFGDIQLNSHLLSEEREGV